VSAAEQVERYRRKKHVTVLRDGQPTRVDYGEIDHCCQNFQLVETWLEAEKLQRKGRVGHAEARLIRSHAQSRGDPDARTILASYERNANRPAMRNDFALWWWGGGGMTIAKQTVPGTGQCQDWYSMAAAFWQLAAA
jgi:hypothetical protein